MRKASSLTLLIRNWSYADRSLEIGWNRTPRFVRLRDVKCMWSNAHWHRARVASVG